MPEIPPRPKVFERTPIETYYTMKAAAEAAAAESKAVADSKKEAGNGR